jgi:hypothetical protein
MAFATVEPFGCEAGFLGHATVAQTIANVNRSKGQKPYKIEDFMPKFEQKAQSVDEMVQIAQMLTIGFGGQDLRGE